MRANDASESSRRDTRVTRYSTQSRVCLKARIQSGASPDPHSMAGELFAADHSPKPRRMFSAKKKACEIGVSHAPEGNSNSPPGFSRSGIQDKNAIRSSMIEVEHLVDGTGNSVKRSLPNPLPSQPVVLNKANH